MKILPLFEKIALVLFLVLLSTNFSHAEEVHRKISRLTVPKGLEGRVEFWKLIFTKYGKNHRVFHNRSHPEVIYSVLDFSEFEEKLSGKELLRAKEQEILKEEEHIKEALQHLAGGGEPRGAFEQRIYRLYKKLPRFSRQKFYQALEADQIRYQTGIMERFRESLVRSGRYLKAIEHIFVEEGLPPELGRIPFIESSFDYTAYSSVGAAGIWQFMPATAKSYMKVNSVLDERRDPIIASRAAAKYLKNSYEDTNSWALTVTSYNHGLTGILRAAREVGSNNIVDIIENYKGKSFGFASSNFYAEFLAALEIERNINDYFPGLQREKAVEFDEVRISKPILFSQLRANSYSSETDLINLNLGFSSRVIQNKVSIPAGTYIKIPAGRYKMFAGAFGAVQLIEQSSSYQAHLYYMDDKPDHSKISLVEDLPKAQVKEVEPTEYTANTEVNTEVVVLGEEMDYASTQESREKAKRQAVIVKKEGSSYKKIKPKSVEDKKSAKKELSKKYMIKKGDTLSSIAKKHGTSVDKLLSANTKLNPKAIKPGQSVTIPK